MGRARDGDRAVEKRESQLSEHARDEKEMGLSVEVVGIRRGSGGSWSKEDKLEDLLKDLVGED